MIVDKQASLYNSTDMLLYIHIYRQNAAIITLFF